MTDPLDDLKSAMKAATPAPDARSRAGNLARAQEIFDRAQGSAGAARPMSDRPTRWAALRTGARQMLTSLTRRPAAALAASTALVAVALVMVLPQGMALLPTGAPDTARPEQVAVKSAPPAPAARTAPASAPSGGAARIAEAPAADMAPPPPMPSFAPQPLPAADTEAYANADPNPVKSTATDPVSTFSVDVDTASYALIRQSLERGTLPPPDAVRVEEMINYFPYDYPAPTGDAAFRPTVSLMQTPWNPDTQLLRIGVQGAMPAIEDRPPLNLVFLIDTSGSMNDAAKLPLLVQSFRLMLGQLRPEDQVAIVTYAGSVGLVLPATAASERATILSALDRLSAGGGTAGQQGLELAYATARGMAAEGEVSRILLATDGDFNLGLSDPAALKSYIARQRDGGTYLSVLGFGRGNLDDATMQALAQNGNGQAAYIDTLNEAQKVLVDQLTGALFPIASDVKVQVEFNPARIAEYRLIGYETRALDRADFNNDAVDAGDIGAGHQVTALYEITPAGSPAALIDPLRYGAAPSEPADPGDEIAFLRLRAKAPGGDTSRLTELPVTDAAMGSDTDAQFAAAIAGFGQILRGAPLNGWGIGDAITLANGAKGADVYGYRAEAVRLMRLAESLRN